MALGTVLNDIRKGSRAMDLRSVAGEEAEELLNNVLKEALAAQASGSKKMMRNSLQELKQTRQDLVTNQIELDKKTRAKYVGAMSTVGRQLKDQFEQSNKKFSEAADSLTSSLPSADTLISAVMTANPLVGYGAKILKNIGGVVSQQKQKVNQENEERLALLEEQKLEIEKQASDEPDNEILHELSDEINNHLMLLNEKIARSNLLLQRIDTNTYELAREFGSEIGDELRELNESQLTMNDIFDKDLAERKRRQTEMRREDDGGTGLSRVKDSDEDDDLGFLDNLNLGGLGSGLLGVMKPITTLLTGLLKFGALALKMVGIGAAVMAVYDFVDGFINASDIVGKEDSEITVIERIGAAASNMIAGFLEIIDWFANLFGYDLFADENLAKVVYDKFGEIKDKMIEFFNSAVGWIKDKFTFFTDKISSVTEGISDFFGGFMDYIQKIVDAYKDGGIVAVSKVVAGDAIEGAKSVVSGAKDKAVDAVGGVYNTVTSWWDDDEENSKKKSATNETAKGEVVYEKVKNEAENTVFSWLGDSVNNVWDSIVGSDEETATTQLRMQKEMATQGGNNPVNINNNVNNNYATTGPEKQEKPISPSNSYNSEPDLRYVNKDILAGLVR